MPDLLSPQSWPFSLDWLPRLAYLVGGGVRDALRGRPSAYLDLDFVLPEYPVEIARQIAHHYNAGFVLLDADRQIARVVFEQGTADFALQMGNSLTADLERRDFTINAIAYNPHNREIIDPLYGYSDLKKGLLRMVKPENLADDPLRLLRAYRQAAQLEFELEPATQIQIRLLAPQLCKIAAERVRAEFSYLLSTPRGTPWMQTAWEDGLLQFWLPATTAIGLEQLAGMDRATAELAELWPALGYQLHRPLSDRARGNEAVRRTLLATAKLVWLVDQRPHLAITDLQRLKYSRSEINLVTTLLKGMPQVVTTTAVKALFRRELFFLFQAVEGAFPALAVLAVTQGVSIEAIAPLVNAWLDPSDAIAHPQPLLTGKDLVTHLPICPGPALGKLLTDLEVAQAEGKITTAAEALALAKILVTESI